MLLAWETNNAVKRALHVGVFVGVVELDFGPHFFTKLVLRSFQALGHQVSLLEPRTPIPPDLDAGILHVAATRVPMKIVSRLPQQIPILNRRVLDISKRRISRMLVESKDDEVGPVIVKSNTNYAGLNDFARLHPAQQRVRRIIRRLLAEKRETDAIPYQIYSSPREVPTRIWTDSGLVVERFLPERHGQLYCLRKWVFLGNTNILVIDRSSKPIVKAGESGQERLWEDVPEELMADRLRLGFDYGKFDFVVHDGKAVLLDANSTPGIGQPTPSHYSYAGLIAEALEQWILSSLACPGAGCHCRAGGSGASPGTS
jgi:hypothetical protein